uniref:Uncharacterized protein n=1 Tax=Rhizophora mucronata TaxID=61149 RepID=A0A2P2PKX1_RHIMU
MIFRVNQTKLWSCFQFYWSDQLIWSGFQNHGVKLKSLGIIFHAK